MSRLIVALLAAVLTAETFSATQTIEATQGFNFVAVELKVGENRLSELFPNAPVGTLVFTWDNHAGWRAAQMYQSGWSHPNERILPWQGAIIVLSANTTLSAALTGEVIPLPRPDYVIFPNSPEIAPFYRGINLVSAKAAKYIAETRAEPASVYAWNNQTMNYAHYQYDGLSLEWIPFPAPGTGAVWFQSTQAPVHPEGAFTNSNTALFFNNYAPAFGIDSPFVFPNCEQRLGLTAQLVRHAQGGSLTPEGDPVNVSTNGYIDPFTNHIRYVLGGQYSVRFEGSAGFQGQTDPFTVVSTAGNLIPILPLGMHVTPTVPVFRTQPEDLTFRPGDDVHLEALFHHAGTLDPQISLDLPYQWQKQNAAGEWIDITGADETTLHLENAQPQHAGAYRLRATYGCEYRFSRTAIVTLMAPTISSTLTTNDQVSLTIQFPVQVTAKVQSSMNLTNWQDEMNIAASSTWTTNLNAEGSVKFYRVIEAP